MTNDEEPGFWDDEPAEPPPPPPPPPDDDAAARELPDPLDNTPRPDTPVTGPLSEGERTRVAAGVRPEDVDHLMNEVTALYGRVEMELADSRAQAERAQAMLSEARTLLLARPEAFPTAELRVQQVRLLLSRVAAARTTLAPQIGSLARQSVGWLIAFAALFVLDGAIARFLAAREWLTIPPGGPVTLAWAFTPWLPLLIGGIGGALGALVLLGTQQGRYEFDPASTLDYRLNAPKGAIWGVVAFYLLLGGFLASAVVTAQADAETLTLADQVRAAASPLMLVLAFLAGFAQPRVMRLLRRVWGDITGDRDEEASAPAPPAEPAPAPEPAPEAAPEPEAGAAAARETRYPVGPTRQPRPRPE